MTWRSYLATREVRSEFVQRNTLKKVSSERECGETCEDEVINKDIEPLQTVDLCQFLEVQVVLFIHLPLQVLAAEIHRSPQLKVHKRSESYMSINSLYFAYKE